MLVPRRGEVLHDRRESVSIPLAQPGPVVDVRYHLVAPGAQQSSHGADAACMVVVDLKAVVADLRCDLTFGGTADAAGPATPLAERIVLTTGEAVLHMRTAWGAMRHWPPCEDCRRDLVRLTPRGGGVHVQSIRDLPRVDVYSYRHGVDDYDQAQREGDR